MAIVSLVVARHFEHEAAALNVQASAMREKLAATKLMIQTETDIAQIRAYAVQVSELDFEEWCDKSYRLHQGSGAMLDASYLQAFIAAILGYIIYGLRKEKPAA
ncbi:MAG: hypothetical protein P4N60_09835 [Verrucomicrobiae bacterium]|nr:hypothetical protein [Verrucomicrobiae bacterium]